MLTNDILQRIDDETDIVELVSEFVSLEKKGKNYMGLCPFHDEKTPSFSVSTEKNIAMCMGCKAGGRPLNFYRQIKNISLAEAAKELGNRIGIKIDVKQSNQDNQNKLLYEIMESAAKFFEVNLFNSLSGHKVLDYLHNRGLSDDTIKEFRLGYSSSESDQLYQFLKSKDYSVTDMIDLGLVKQGNKGNYYDLFNNRLMFPITNTYGKVVGFSGRTLDKNDNVKYVNSPETIIFKKGQIVYNLNEASLEIRRKQSAILYEGFFDVISAYQAGSKNGIATMGTALTSNQANLIKKTIDNVVIAYDGDKAGINATISAIPILVGSNLQVTTLTLPDKLDPDDYIKKYGNEAYLELLETNVSDPYSYQFDHYLSLADLNNANDIEKFQSNITKMLKNAKPAIVSLYKNKLATTLNIDVNDINIQPTKQPKVSKQVDPYEPVEYKSQYDDYKPEELGENTYQGIPYNEPITYTKKLPYNIKPQAMLDHRFMVAEKKLLIYMTISKENHDYIASNLTINEYSDMKLYLLRIKLKSHYDFYDEFNLEDFLRSLNEDERIYFKENIQNDEYWNNKDKFKEKEVDDFITNLMGTSVSRRIIFLKDLMIEKGNRRLPIENENIEYIQKKWELMKLKGELTNNG